MIVVIAAEVVEEVEATLGVAEEDEVTLGIVAAADFGVATEAGFVVTEEEVSVVTGEEEASEGEEVVLLRSRYLSKMIYSGTRYQSANQGPIATPAHRIQRSRRPRKPCIL